MKALRKKYRKGGLVGKQHKLDKNKDGKITGQDFKMMKDGGKLSKGKRPKKMKKMADKAQVGAPASNKEIRDWKERTRGSRADVELRATVGKSLPQWFDDKQKSFEVPNKALAKKTADYGMYGKMTKYSGNPGGLKGRTKGKGGNVGAGVKVKKKKKR